MTRRPTVVLFDIDGTLVTCGGAGRRAMEAAFEQMSGRRDVCAFSFGGLTDRSIARTGLSAAGAMPTEAAIDALLDCYLSHLPRELEMSPGYAVLEGVRELLDALVPHSHVQVGLGTGNVRAGARAKLGRGGLNERFAFGGFGCDAEDRARVLAIGALRGASRHTDIEPDACRVIVVGDTPRDVAAATAIGADTIAVATGGYDASVLREAGAAVVVDDLRAGVVVEAIVG